MLLDRRMPPTFVYFDLDNTLLDHTHAERHALDDVRAEFDAFDGHSLDTLHTTYHEHSAALWTQYADGEIDKETLHHERFARTLTTLGVNTVAPNDIGAYYMQRYAEHWRYVPEARAAFMEVAEHVPVGVLTNGFAETQQKKLDRFPELRDLSDAIVITEHVGRLKPHPKAFAHAEQKAGVAADAILYVGDSHRSDVIGGHKAGWRVAWYAPPTASEPVPDGCFRFDDWATLLDAVRLFPADAPSP